MLSQVYKNTFLQSILLMLLPLVFYSCHTAQKTQRSFDTIIDYSDTGKVQQSSLNFSNSAFTQSNNTTDTTGWALRTKYANMIGITPSEIHNLKLYKFIDEWLGTRYLWGGTTKRGIDCSAFVQRLYADVYNIKIPRTSIEQFFTNDVEPFASSRYLSEGDMVFFKTLENENVVTHVGFYLGNNRFVNASSHGGVCIGSLADPYWSTKYVVAGRIKNPNKY